MPAARQVLRAAAVPLPLLCIAVGCAGGPPAEQPPAAGDVQAQVLASGLGRVTLLALADQMVYFTEATAQGVSVRGVPIGGGAAFTVAAGLADVPSLAALGSACAYPDVTTGDLYWGSATAGPTLAGLGFSGEVGTWVASEGDVVVFTTTDTGLVASVGLSVPDGSGESPTAPPDFLRAIGAAPDAMLLAAGSESVYMAVGGASTLASLPRSGTAADQPETLADTIGTIAAIDAEGTRYAAAGSAGVYANGRVISSTSDAVAVAVMGDSVLYATSTALLGRISGRAEERVLSATDATAVDARGTVVVLADNPAGGGRIRLLDLGQAQPES